MQSVDSGEPDLLYFAHGMESGPWGTKISALAVVARERGFRVCSPDYSHTRDPDARVRQLLDEHPATAGHLVLVGSSMGAYVSAVASGSLRPDGLFLMAPAMYLPGYEADPMVQAKRMAVVHGWRDNVVPVANAIRFAQTHRAALHVLDGGHRLAESLPAIRRIFANFLDEILGIEEEPPHRPA
ncbi:MAG TPA: alpha/beta hydrolase [Gammaproteobacteria bacterium]|nr:alpha/beta hydrolase [Gammaproteobacteria bacterium]